jgi:transitional endoplasmic reticulum ATPase
MNLNQQLASVNTLKCRSSVWMARSSSLLAIGPAAVILVPLAYALFYAYQHSLFREPTLAEGVLGALALVITAWFCSLFRHPGWGSYLMALGVLIWSAVRAYRGELTEGWSGLNALATALMAWWAWRTGIGKIGRSAMAWAVLPVVAALGVLAHHSAVLFQGLTAMQSRVAMIGWMVAWLIPLLLISVVNAACFVQGHLERRLNASRTTANPPEREKVQAAAPLSAPTDAAAPAITPAKRYDYPAHKASSTFEDVAGMAELKTLLLNAAKRMIAPGAKENGILLHGLPGNGKTFIINSLAGELGVPILTATAGDLLSRWVNESTENAMQLCEDAINQAPCVLFIDEVDAILTKRGDPSSVGESNKVTTALLARLEALRGHQVLLIGATNCMNLIDTASVREGRFDMKIDVPNPDFEGRFGLIDDALAKVPGVRERVADSVLVWLAHHYAGFSVARLKTVTETVARSEGDDQITVEDFTRALRLAQGGAKPDERTADLADIELAPDTARTLRLLTAQMKDVYRFEQKGGELVKGMLFSGPPGTGKTMVARAIAKAAGWNLVVASGTELAQAPHKIDEVIDSAINLKPCVLFIDEAEPLIQNRASSWNASAAAKFLQRTGTDTSGLIDVLLLAATNFPDGVDDAMVRGGRLEQHIKFSLPSADQIERHLKQAFAGGEWVVSADLARIAQSLVKRSIADVNFSLRKAKNFAASRAVDGGALEIRDSDFENF